MNTEQKYQTYLKKFNLLQQLGTKTFEGYLGQISNWCTHNVRGFDKYLSVLDAPANFTVKITPLKPISKSVSKDYKFDLDTSYLASVLEQVKGGEVSDTLELSKYSCNLGENLEKLTDNVPGGMWYTIQVTPYCPLELNQYEVLAFVGNTSGDCDDDDTGFDYEQ